MSENKNTQKFVKENKKTFLKAKNIMRKCSLQQIIIGAFSIIHFYNTSLIGLIYSNDMKKEMEKICSRNFGLHPLRIHQACKVYYHGPFAHKIILIKNTSVSVA